MGLPENSIVFVLDETVVGIVGSCLLKRRISSVHDEQDDASSEDIGFGSFIVFGRNLRSHITLSSEFGMKNSRIILSLQQAGESEVGQLQGEVPGKQNVLGFDVSVGVPLGVHVMESVHHLVEVGAGDFLGKLAGFGNVVEQLTASHVLDHDGEALESGLIFFLIGSIFANIDELDEVRENATYKKKD